MSENKPHDAYYTSSVIEFDQSPALLGANTNGAAPQRIYGLYVSANLCESNGKPSGGYWLKANTAKPRTDDPDHFKAFEHVAYVNTPQEVEAILGAIVSASLSSDFERALPGKMGGWHNSGQLTFSEDTPEGCVYDLSCRIGATKRGFNLRLFDATSYRATNVATVEAKLTSDGIDTALKIVRELNDWAAEHTRIIEQQIEAKDTASAVPGLR